MKMLFSIVEFSGSSLLPAIFPWGLNQCKAPLFSVLKCSDVESFASNPAICMEEILKLIPKDKRDEFYTAMSQDSISMMELANTLARYTFPILLNRRIGTLQSIDSFQSSFFLLQSSCGLFPDYALQC